MKHHHHHHHDPFAQAHAHAVALHLRRIEKAGHRGRVHAVERAEAERLRTMHRGTPIRVPWQAHASVPSSLQALATRVLERDVSAYEEAMETTHALDDLHAHVGRDGLRIFFSEGAAHVAVRAPLGDSIPLASQDPDSPLHSASDRNDVYQDYVCSIALRAARELLAVLPLELVTVDAWFVRPTEPPAIDAPPPPNVRILSVLCARGAMDAIPWDTADASRVVQSLPHQMDFAVDRGFYPVGHVRAV